MDFFLRFGIIDYEIIMSGYFSDPFSLDEKAQHLR